MKARCHGMKYKAHTNSQLSRPLFVPTAHTCYAEQMSTSTLVVGQMWCLFLLMMLVTLLRSQCHRV